MILVAMATGTGRTFTLVNQIYRLMKSAVARRVLFLVDRGGVESVLLVRSGKLES